MDKGSHHSSPLSTGFVVDAAKKKKFLTLISLNPLPPPTHITLFASVRLNSTKLPQQQQPVVDPPSGETNDRHSLMRLARLAARAAPVPEETA